MLIALFASIFSIQLIFAKEIIQSKGIVDTQNGKLKLANSVVVDGERVLEIGEFNKLSEQYKGYKIIDISDQYIMPSFFDCHTHVFLTQTLEDVDFEKALVREVKISGEFRLTRAKKYLKDYLKSGFGQLCDLGNSGNFLDVGLRDEIVSDSDYPYLFVSGKGFATKKAQFAKDIDKDLVEKEYQLDLGNFLKDAKNKNVDILKIYLDNSPGIGELENLELIRLLNTANKSQFKKITFHSISDRENFDWSLVDNIEHLYFVPKNDKFFNQKKFVTITDVHKDLLLEFKYYSKAQEILNRNRILFLKSKNVKMVFGSDLYFERKDISVDRGREAIKSLLSLKEKGLSNKEILQMVTVNPAASLKLSHQFGEVKKGSRANLIATKVNPLVSLEGLLSLSFVMNKGKIILNKH